MSWPAEDIVAALGGADDTAQGSIQIRGTIPDIDGIEIDTRRLTDNALFLAFRGTHVDGHDYLDAAMAGGAVLALVEDFQDHPLPQICVKNMRDALWQLAKYARDKQKNTTFVAITGSVGKTSTRSMMEKVFSTLMLTYASSGNFNNDLGMPLCLAQMGCVASWEVAVFELGMSAANEIAPLSLLLKPDIALVLNVREVHQESFNNIENIAEAKAEIFLGLRPSGLALIPDQPEFNEIFLNAIPDKAIVEIYNAPDNYSWIDNVLYNLNKPILFDDGSLRRYQSNILAVCAVCSYARSTAACNQMVSVLSRWQPDKGRGRAYRAILQSGAGVTIIDDSYNASLPSMLACLTDLQTFDGTRKIAILGDMKELGNMTYALHRQLVEHLNENSFDAVFIVGDVLKSFSNEIINLECAVSQAEEIIAPLNHYAQDGDVLAFKASRSIGLDRVIAAIAEQQK